MKEGAAHLNEVRHDTPLGAVAYTQRVHTRLLLQRQRLLRVRGKSVGSARACGRAGSHYPFLTQKERDNETGLDYFGARYYASIQGRFTSADEFTGGPEEIFEDVDPHDPLFYADATEPQSLNKYHYCLNNPLRYIDPDGHQTSTSDRLKQGATAVYETGKGVVKGALSSLTGGLIGAPKPTDSENDRAGQYAGSVAVEVHGAVNVVEGGIQEALAFVDGGITAPTGTVQLTAGAAEMIGAQANIQRIANTPIQRNSTTNPAPKPVEGSSGGPGAGKRPSEATKDAVRSRDSNRCVYCRTKTTRTSGRRQSNIDHSDPKSRGGDTTMKNLQNTCRSCNLKKGAKTNKEFLNQN